MIEYNIMQLLQNNDPFEMLFSINYTTEKDNVVTVYSVPSNAPSIYEGVVYEDSFQIVVKSSDFDKATEIAYDIQETLHKLQNVVMQIQLKTKTIPVRVFFIRSLHEPALLGVNDDDVMEYSLNFRAQLKRITDA
ncbi:minor capsid protein [Staphylococcus haemolyticus]|uniref:minor capsid protein n=2 Tax=Staphylococcus haemolyticus TaxID=1283 RepID=UPI000CEB69E7|nr:minor capsid protein [Staphylococcus haemolyticus]AVH47465.1 minor capsid protein [Staphylococcus haemolyticus]TXD08212.1 minor capsid protein [Staphylococcus haemolyticus]UUY76946.1 minor capsid protein [Staphylococcus haemolyticus]